MSELVKPPEAALLAKELRSKERHEARLAVRQAKLKSLIGDVKLDAARKVALRKHAFKSDEELAALKLTAPEIALVRQWQEPKRNAAFAIESSARLIESEVRAQGEAKRTTVNVENMTIQLPDKAEDPVAPVYIDVEVK